jgi:hypothetical protein
MAEPSSPRRKTSPLAFERHTGHVRPLARASSLFALPTVAALLRAGAVVSAAVSIGAGVVACGHDDDGAKITADEQGRSGAVKAAVGVVRTIELPSASATVTAVPAPTEGVKMAGAVAPIRTLPVPTASVTAPIGLATPPPIVPTVTPPPAPGGPHPTTASTIAPTPLPPTPGGKPKAVVPTPAGTGQAPCPSPNGYDTTT